MIFHFRQGASRGILSYDWVTPQGTVPVRLSWDGDGVENTMCGNSETGGTNLPEKFVQLFSQEMNERFATFVGREKAHANTYKPDIIYIATFQELQSS